MTNQSNELTGFVFGFQPEYPKPSRAELAAQGFDHLVDVFDDQLEETIRIHEAQGFELRLGRPIDKSPELTGVYGRPKFTSIN